MADINNCDKCGVERESKHLVWITAEGFEPREGEIVPPELYKKYDALCGRCYLSEINVEEMGVEEARKQAAELFEKNNQAVVMKSCWNCKPEHEHLKIGKDFILGCIECKCTYFNGVEITLEKIE